MITSILDSDLYKFSMAQAVLKLYPNAHARYAFVNRDKSREFSLDFAHELQDAVDEMANVRLYDVERRFLEKACPYLEPWFLEWLHNYRFDPAQVRISHEIDNQLELRIVGPWRSTILWEVPLLAMISELYFKGVSPIGHIFGTNDKMLCMGGAGCKVADFGTRRRFSREVHKDVVRTLMGHPNFTGTSNVRMAMDYDLKPIGTMAHEWIQGVSALEGLRYANKCALRRWENVYHGQLGIALTDTFGSDAFFRDFGTSLSRLFDGVRHDSGDPIIFARRVVNHYKEVGIDPATKVIIFSDGLNADKAIDIQSHCDSLGIPCAFGIGTNLTNDVGVKPLNMVIKLRAINEIEVVKLSDDPGKAIGSKAAIDAAKWTFGLR